MKLEVKKRNKASTSRRWKTYCEKLFKKKARGLNVINH